MTVPLGHPEVAVQSAKSVRAPTPSTCGGGLIATEHHDPKSLRPSPVGLPSTLPGRLYLAAYNPRGRTFGGDNLWLFEFALRAAVVTELFLQGHLIDVAGRPQQADAPPETASLQLMWDEIPPDTSSTWAEVISTAPAVSAGYTVPAELRAAGWLCERRRRFAVMPGLRLQPADMSTADEAGDEARQALAGIVAQQPVSIRSRALGLLAFHAQLPVTISFNDDARSRAAVVNARTGELPPLVGLAEAIQGYFGEVRAEMNWGDE